MQINSNCITKSGESNESECRLMHICDTTIGWFIALFNLNGSATVKYSGWTILFTFWFTEMKVYWSQWKMFHEILSNVSRSCDNCTICIFNKKMYFLRLFFLLYALDNDNLSSPCINQMNGVTSKRSICSECDLRSCVSSFSVWVPHLW